MNRGTIVRNDIIYSGEKDKVSYVPTLREGTEIGTLTINGEDNVLYAPAGGGGGGSYTLPAATSTTLGGIKVGENLTIDDDGVLSAENGGGASAWEDLTDKPFETLSETDFEVDENNVLSIKDKGTDVSYTATIEEGTELGTLSIDGEDEIIYAPITAKELTFAEYMALTEEEKNADVAYYISDAPGTVSTVSQAVAFSTQGGTENTLRFGKNENGEYGYYPPGADTLVPFKSGSDIDFSKLIYKPYASDGSIIQDRFLFSPYQKSGIIPHNSKIEEINTPFNYSDITSINLSNYSTFRIVCCFGTTKASSTFNHGQVLFGSYSGGYWYTPSVEIFSSDIGCGYSVAGSNAWTGWLSIPYTFQVGKFYYIEFKWTNNNKITYTLYDEEGNILGTRSATVSSSCFNSNYFSFGCFSDRNHNMDSGPFIDLHNTFVEINDGEMIYGCNRDKIL